MRPVVMYHYIRDPEGSRFPAIYSRKLSQFDFQLAHLESTLGVGSFDDLAHSSGSTALLTFDDGLKDHFHHAFPALLKRKMQGAFFVSSLPLLKPVVLDVHKIQLLLGSQSHERLFELLASDLGSYRLREYEESEAISGDSARFDSQKIILFKRLLQRDLEASLRSEILNKIFIRFYPGEEEQISRHLYMSLTELRVMRAAGMVIGNHTVNHLWLGHLEIAKAKREIAECENFLIQEELMSSELKMIAYPYGDVNSQIEAYLLDSEYSYGFTTVAERWDSARVAPMRIPRLDTNDVPFQ